MKKQILIFDTTLRDGEQSPGCSMNLESKVQLARQLEMLGSDIIEAGFPIASDGDYRAVRAVSETVEKATVAALCRTREEDIDRACDALRDARNKRIHTFIATSEIHMKYKLSMTRQQVLDAIVFAVSKARKFTEDVEFSAEDASRTEHDFLNEVIRTAIRAGATTVNLPDTVGFTTPTEYGELFARVRDKVPESRDIHLSAHTHDDLGMAVANSLAAIENGADQIECTVNGIGERAGNAALETVVMAIKTRSQFYNAHTSINSKLLYPTSQLLSAITGVYVQPNKAIVGKNAFAHEAGIHQHGMLNNALTYEIITPESVGVQNTTLVLGKHSGRHALRHRCKVLGYTLKNDELDSIYKGVTELAEKQKEISDDDLRMLIIDEIKKAKDNQVLVE